MAYTLTPVEIGDKNSTDAFHAMTRGVITLQLQVADYVANHAIDLHPRMVNLLRTVGADSPSGLFGRGSSAEGHAKAVYRVLQKAANHAEGVAQLMRAADRAWDVHIVEAVRAAEAERARSRNTLSV
jgi:hypothetical protein